VVPANGSGATTYGDVSRYREVLENLGVPRRIKGAHLKPRAVIELLPNLDLTSGALDHHAVVVRGIGEFEIRSLKDLVDGGTRPINEEVRERARGGIA